MKKKFLKWVFSNNVMCSSKCFKRDIKIKFRIYLNLCSVKLSRIDVENRVNEEVILSLHFSIASFNMSGSSKFLTTIFKKLRHLNIFLNS